MGIRNRIESAWDVKMNAISMSNNEQDLVNTVTKMVIKNTGRDVMKSHMGLSPIAVIVDTKQLRQNYRKRVVADR